MVYSVSELVSYWLVRSHDTTGTGPALASGDQFSEARRWPGEIGECEKNGHDSGTNLLELPTIYLLRTYHCSWECFGNILDTICTVLGVSLSHVGVAIVGKDTV